MGVQHLAFVLACLACAGQTRRVQFQSAGGQDDPVKALGKLLSEFNSAAAFNPSSLGAHAVHRQEHRAAAVSMQALDPEAFAKQVGMDYAEDKVAVDRMIALGVAEDILVSQDYMSKQTSAIPEETVEKPAEPDILGPMLEKATTYSSLMAAPEPAPAPAPAPVEEKPKAEEKPKEEAKPAPAPAPEKSKKEAKKAKKEEKKAAPAPAPVEAKEEAKPKAKPVASKKEEAKPKAKPVASKKEEAKPEAAPAPAPVEEFVSVPTGLVWPSDEAEAKLREVDGIKMYPTHAWTDAMTPVLPATAKVSKTPVMIGVAADSGCGKSTFLRRILGALGTDVKPGHTAIGEMMTVVCLDDYHTNDRAGRKATGLTALDAAENDFALMGAQMEALKEGKAVYKPIYNHDTGNKDPPELLQPNKLMVFEGLHPIYDAKSREVLDMGIYIDIVNDVKFAWKVQRDVAERGWTEEQVKEDIEKRLPDFSAFVDPQKADADVILRYEPSDKGLPDLKVKLIQKKGGSFPMVTLKETVELKSATLKMYDDDWFGSDVTVVEMDGTLDMDNMEAELKQIETNLEGLNGKTPTELTDSMVKLKASPGSDNGTGVLQNVIGMKVREVYEKLTA